MLCWKLLLTLVIALLISSPRTYGQDARLVEAAKKEGGKVVIYGALEGDTTDEIMKAFTKKTGIEAEYWRASATKVLDRALTEHRGGVALYDVALINSDPVQILHQHGAIANYTSPSVKDFPKNAIDPKIGPRYRNVIVGVVYNKSVLKPDEFPKSLEDVVKPQYKGKLVMPDPTQHATTTQWISSLHKIMSKEKADKFIRDLAAMKPVFVESLLPAAERVTTGETPIAISFIKYAHIFGLKGAPIDFVKTGTMLSDGHYAPLNVKAPHPNAGKAFIDFLFGDDGMSILAKRGEFVNRKGIYPPLPGADKIQSVEMIDLSEKGYGEKKKELRTIFFQ